MITLRGKFQSMKICSLLPSATEILFALGLGEDVAGVSHECDFPPEARSKPVLIRSRISHTESAAAIDRQVREFLERGESLYSVDFEVLAAIEPDLIVTQELCPVCAVSYDDVRAVAQTIATQPKVVALDPHTLGESFGDVRTIAQLTDSRDAALELIARQRARVDAVRVAVRGAERAPVAAIEWLDPVFVAGHWTPQIIDLAGGIDVLGFPGEPSEQTTWETVAAAGPRIVVCMPCGYDADRSLAEAFAHLDALRGLGAQRVVAVDAAAYFSRPGPRLVDGLELMAHILHPDLVPEAPGVVHEVEV